MIPPVGGTPPEVDVDGAAEPAKTGEGPCAVIDYDEAGRAEEGDA